MRGGSAAQVKEARERLAAAEAAMAEAEAAAAAELDEVGREDALLAASVAEMEGAVR